MRQVCRLIDGIICVLRIIIELGICGYNQSLSYGLVVIVVGNREKCWLCCAASLTLSHDINTCTFMYGLYTIVVYHVICL